MDKSQFSKNNTLVFKGFAILLMLAHHLFRETSLFSGYDVSFILLGQDLVMDLSNMGKICVSIFAFITGYGLTLSLKKLNEKYNWSKKQICKWTVNRLIKTMAGFWIIAVLAYIICQAINGMTGDVFFQNGICYGILQLVINFLGLSDFFGLDNFNSAWWYMTLAILFILSMPVFLKLFKRFGYLPVMLAVIIIPRVIRWEFISNNYISFLSPLLFGIIFAENNLMVKIANIKINKNKYLNKIIKFVIETIMVILLINIYIHLPLDKFWELTYGIIPVCIMCYLYEFFVDLPIIKTIFGFLGKHSMNIFLVHEFIRTYYLTDFIYSFHNFILIETVLIICSTAISIVLELFKKLIRYNKLIEKLQDVVSNVIDNKKRKQLLLSEKNN